MQRSNEINELAAALVAVQTTIQPAIKDKTNPAFKGSKYADLGAVWDACREALGSNGLSIVQMPAPAEPGYAALETLLMHTSGQFISNVAAVRLARDDAQGAGSAYTYLRRYSLAAFIGVVADEDDDGNTASAPNATYERPAKAPAPRTQQQPQRPPAAPAEPAPKPATAAEAKQRFFARYSETVGGTTWQAVQAWLPSAAPEPQTVDGWIKVAEEVRAAVKRQAARKSGTALEEWEAEYAEVDAALATTK